MTARVRPSLNIAREALKAWDEANVVWPRIEVRRTLLPRYSWKGINIYYY